ncbi:MAG: cysteine hydrolase [Rhodospirillaceae bacterium]|nr:MAG: cysteine hydrolase [Rhodospirillaceae bacterium]
MKKSILLVMDMINDLVSETGPNATTYVPLMRDRGVLEHTRAAIAAARSAGVLIGYVRIGFSPDYRECPPASPIFSRARQNGLFKLGTDGTAVHAMLTPQAGDFDIVKHRVSPFYGTSLEPILSANGVERLFLCGVSTNGVVHTGAREAHDRDFECVVLEDCCAGATVEEHERALYCVGRFATIASSDKIDFRA